MESRHFWKWTLVLGQTKIEMCTLILRQREYILKKTTILTRVCKQIAQLPCVASPQTCTLFQGSAIRAALLENHMHHHKEEDITFCQELFATTFKKREYQNLVKNGTKE